MSFGNGLVVAMIKFCSLEVLHHKIRLSSDKIRSKAVEYSLKLRILLEVFVLLDFLKHAGSDSHGDASLQGTVFVLLHFLQHVE